MRIVEVRPALQNPVGILVIGGILAKRIDADYAQAAARVAVGLVSGMQAELESLESTEAA
jgi:hypothetical protein